MREFSSPGKAPVSDVVEGEHLTGITKVLNITLTIEWHDALDDFCREVRPGHAEYNRFRDDSSGRFLSKTSLIKTLVREHIKRHRE